MDVELTGALRSAVGGAATVTVYAENVRELITRLVDRYPDLQTYVDEGIAVAINGNIIRDDWRVEIPEGAEVYLMPRVPGG